MINEECLEPTEYKLLKWEKGLCKKTAVKYLKKKCKESPCLFVHWLLVHP